MGGQPGPPLPCPGWQRLAALRFRLAIIGTILLLSALTTAVAITWSRHEATLEQARAAASDLALVLAREADAAVQKADGALFDLQERLAEDSESMDSPLFVARLNRRAASLPQNEPLLAVDGAGKVVVASAPIDESRQAWIAAAMPGLAARFPELPLLGRAQLLLGNAASGSDLMLVRSVATPQGHFGGALIALLSPDSLIVLRPDLALPHRSVVALLSRDGTPLVRRPGQGPPLPPIPASFAQSATETLLLTAPPQAVGGAAHIVALHTLKSAEGTVLVAVDRHEALAAWRSDAELIATGSLAGAASILLLLHALLVQFRRVEESQASLEAANQDLLRKSHELETTLANMDQGLMMVDSNRRVVVCNARAIEMLGLPAELIAARPSFQQVLDYQWEQHEFEGAPAEMKTLARASELLDKPLIYARRRPDGRLLEVHSVPMADGGVVRTYTDITARALDEERFRQIVNDSPLAMALINARDGRFVQVNTACCALLGRVGSELVGQPWTDVVHPDDRTPAGPRTGSDTRLLAADGHVVLTRLKHSRLPAARGGPPLLLVIGEDVTHQRDMEARLRQAQRLEAVGQLTGGVAHDFNNLLGVIMLDAELLTETVAGDPDAIRLAGEILGAASSGAELTHRLLAFARRQALQPCAIDLNAAISEAAKLLRRTLGETIEVCLAPARGGWAVRADPSQFGDALLNLALNARDAMPDGGQVTIGTGNRTVPPGKATAELPAGDYVAVTVSDTGCGMPREVLERAVEPFFTTKPPGTGSGLGLSMIYGFARQSGGALLIESAPGRGTTVRLLLPRAPDPAGAAQGTPATAELPGGRETILLVDDNEAVRHVTARQLEGLGYQVREAANGSAALAVLRAGQPVDLLFTDVVMPGGLAGPDLARAAQSERPGLKVLFTSGFARAEDSAAPDPSPLIRKPYRRRALAEQVRAALESEA